MGKAARAREKVTVQEMLPLDSPVQSVPQEPVCFDRSETIEKMAKDLIREHHPELVSLDIVYLWSNRNMQKGGKEIIAKICKASALIKSLTGHDVIVIASYPQFQSLTDKQKRACIDHELCHVLIDEDVAGTPKVKIVAHDVEEFGAVIERHGLYMSDLTMLGRVVRKVLIREANGAKKVVKLRPGEDPVERAIEEHEIDEDELV
jgi:predicted metallopeptidase